MPETYGATALTALLTPVVDEDLTDDETMFADEVASLVTIATFEERFRKHVVEYAYTIERIAKNRVILADPLGDVARKEWEFRFDSDRKKTYTDEEHTAYITAAVTESIADDEGDLKALRYRFPGIADAAAAYAASE